MIVKPPPVLDDSRVLWFAPIVAPARYSGHSHLFVDGQELGPVPALAIAKSFRDGEVLLLHCDRRWRVLGAGGGFRRVADAKARAERTYPGVGVLWQRHDVTAPEARRFRDEQFKGQECSFCGRLPYDVNTIVQSGSARICDHCVRAFSSEIDSETPN